VDEEIPVVRLPAPGSRVPDSAAAFTVYASTGAGSRKPEAGSRELDARSAFAYYYYGAGQMGQNQSLGEFEQLVLLAIVHLAPDAYGVTIRREIESRTGRSVAVGALYTALERLERRGLVRSSTSDPTPQRGGRSKRHFTIRPAGAAALERSREAMERMWAGIKRGQLRTRS
jgi:PadR family transcriptional regulator, regulatory protein PadR